MSEDVDKEGCLYKKPGKGEKKKFVSKGLKYYYINLIGGSLHYYKDAEDADPKGSITLNELVFTAEFRKAEKQEKDGESGQWVLRLANEKTEYIFEAETESEWSEWKTAIESNLKKAPKPPLKKEKRKSKAQNFAHMAKKGMANKVAATGVGKKALRSKAPEEVSTLIQAIRNIVEKEAKNPKKGLEIEENIYKLGIKMYFLIQENKIKFDDLLVADTPVRAALEIMAKCHDHVKYSRKVDADGLKRRFEEVQKLLGEAAHILGKLCDGHIKPKNIQKIVDTLVYLGDANRLMNIFTDKSLDEPLLELITASEHYTQFHFYPEDKHKGKSS